MTPYLDVPTLAHNLYNLYICEEKNLDLIPYEDGRALYAEGFNKYLITIGPEEKARLLPKIIALTHRSLHYHMTREWDDSELYEYSTYLSQFVKMVLLQEKPVRDRNPIETPVSLIATCHTKMKARLTLKRFEEKTNYDLPLEALKKLPEMHLTRRLEPWIERLNSRSKGEAWFWERWLGYGERISAIDVHRVIKVLANKWSYDPDGMIYRLCALGCQVFDTPDQKFLLKREQWIQNRSIRWKGEEFPLGYQVKGFNQNETLIFKIRGQRKFVVLSNNTALLQLERIHHHQLWDQVRSSPLHYHEPLLCGDGFQIFKQFDHRLTAPPWKSKRLTEVYQKTLIDFVWHMLQNHYTPRKLSMGSLGWIDGQLFTAESVMMDNPVHIPLLGRYIWEWTRGAPKVYRGIMKATRLDQCKEKEFFEQILTDIVENNQRLLWQMAKDEGYYGNAAFERSLHWISTHGYHFQKQAKELAEKVGPDTVLSTYCEKQALGFLDPEWFPS